MATIKTMANKTKGITVMQLALECMKQIKAGNGKRHIIISGDDEGNSFHELFFGFTPCKEAIGDDAYLYPYGVTPEQAAKEYITLG